MQFSVYQESHIGGRKVNQDRMGYSFTRDALLLVLADGMGGHIRGEVAVDDRAADDVGAVPATRHALREEARALSGRSTFAAHREIHRYRAVNNLPETPRTTMVACLIQHNSAIWAHCGDSRLYWMRRGQILAARATIRTSRP